MAGHCCPAEKGKGLLDSHTLWILHDASSKPQLYTTFVSSIPGLQRYLLRDMSRKDHHCAFLSVYLIQTMAAPAWAVMCLFRLGCVVSVQRPWLRQLWAKLWSVHHGLAILDQHKQQRSCHSQGHQRRLEQCHHHTVVCSTLFSASHGISVHATLEPLH